MQTLAAAAEHAHRAGVSLSIDHPSRVRVSIEGDVVLAFPATMPDATPEDDIRGIGAALYALLINRWALPESGVRSGLEPAEVDAAGEPVEPRAIDRDIPFQISAAAARSVQAGGGIRSAPTLLNLLQQATAVADRTELISPVDEPEAPPRPTRVRAEGAARTRCGGQAAQGADRRAERRRRDHRRRVDRAGVGAEPHLRRRRRILQGRSRPQRPEHLGRGRRWRWRLAPPSNPLRQRSFRPRERPTRPIRPGWRSTAMRRPCGLSTPTRTRCHSRTSRTASACCSSCRSPPRLAR